MNTELAPSAQLRAAARLIERARAQLNAQKVTCGKCGQGHFAVQVEGFTAMRLEAMPAKLVACADDLDKHTE